MRHDRLEEAIKVREGASQRVGRREAGEQVDAAQLEDEIAWRGLGRPWFGIEFQDVHGFGFRETAGQSACRK